MRNKKVYDTVPVTEDEARAQVQGISDQIREFINGDLIAELQSVTTDYSGADRIGSAAIQDVETSPGVSAVTVRDQLVAIKAIAEDAVAGSLIPGCIDNANMFAADVVTQAAIGNGQVGSTEIAGGAIGNEHLSDDCVTGAEIADGSIGSGHYAEGSIEAVHIASDAVSEQKLAQNAVTSTKIKNGAVTVDKILNGNVTVDKIADNAVTANKILNGNVTAIKIANDAVGTEQLGTVTTITMGSNDVLSYNGAGYLQLVANGAAARIIPTITFGTSSTPSGNTVPGSIYIRY